MIEAKPWRNYIQLPNLITCARIIGALLLLLVKPLSLWTSTRIVGDLFVPPLAEERA